MDSPRKSQRLTWGELFFIFAVVGGAIALPWIAGFYASFWFSWISYAVFVGMTAALTLLTRPWEIRWHLFVGLIILSGIALSLRDQHFFAASTFKNWAFSLAAIIGFFFCTKVNRSLVAPVRRVLIPVTWMGFLLALLWTLASPCQVFLPVLFFPKADLNSAHQTFLTIFGAAVGASGLGTLVIGRLKEREPSPVEKSDRFRFLSREMSVKAKFSGFGGVFALIVLLLTIGYFLPGSSSGSGGLFGVANAEILERQEGSIITQIESILVSEGFSKSPVIDESLVRDPRKITILEQYQFEIAPEKLFQVTLFRSAEPKELRVQFRYGRISAYQAGKARQIRERLRHAFDGLRQEINQIEAEQRREAKIHLKVTR